MKLLSWQVASASGEGRGWSESCAWARAGLLWRKEGGLSLLENFEDRALSFLCFHDKCPENTELKPLKISVQGNVQCFQSLLLFLFRPKLLSKFVLN